MTPGDDSTVPPLGRKNRNLRLKVITKDNHSAEAEAEIRKYLELGFVQTVILKAPAWVCRAVGELGYRHFA